MLNNKQKIREPHSNKAIQKSKNVTLSLPDKESAFMNHFNQLRDSKVNVSKTSRATTSSQYQHVESLIVKIQQTFDNGQICDIFKPIPKFTKSNGYLAFPSKISSSIVIFRQINYLSLNMINNDLLLIWISCLQQAYYIDAINHFFETGKPLLKQNIIPPILNVDQYSDYLASYALIPKRFEEVVQIKKQQKNKSSKNVAFDAVSQTVLEKNVIKSKVDLLIAELCSEKRRRDDSGFFQEGMVIKLSEFIDYIVEDDDRYLGLSIYAKAFQIDKNLSHYRGKEIDGYLKIPLIQLFFKQLKELQKYKLAKLKQIKKKVQKMQTCSQKEKKSVKSSSSKGGKYSEGNSKKQKQIQQQEWIGKLQ